MAHVGTVTEMNPPPSPFDAPRTPAFGRIQNVPFIFNTPAPQSSHAPAWVPPTTSPMKAPRFPEPELRDVDMSEASPPAPRPTNNDKEGQEKDEDGRSIATGALKRVFKSRQKAKARERSRLALVVRRGKSRGRVSDDEDTGDEDEGSDEDDDDEYEALVQRTSNHYTLNVPAPAPPKSETPYLLLG